MVDVVGFFKREFGESTPIVFETDCNAPAMAQMGQIKQNQADTPTVVYVTIGTGVGVGARGAYSRAFATGSWTHDNTTHG